MDFGIARPTDASFHTIDGTFVGTIHYLPPEQLKGEPIDIRTDIYSLAATLYETLTGFKAFPQYNVSKLIIEKTKNSYKPLSDYRLKIPGAMKNLIRRCMHNNPQKRFPNAKTIYQRLEVIHNNITSESPQQVIKKAINARSYEKIVIPTRNLYIRNLSVAAVILLVIGISSKIAIQIYNNRHSDKAAQIISLKNNKNLAKMKQLKPIKSENSSPKNKISRKTGFKVKAPFRKMQTKKKQETTPAQESVLSKDPETENPQTVNKPDTYDLESLLGNMANDYNSGNYSNILNTFNQLLEKDKKLQTAQLYKLRALSKLNDQAELNNFVNQQTINDGEYYLIKGKIAYKKDDITNAKKYLDISLRTPCTFLSNKKLKQEAYYYHALCATKQFDADPSEENYKTTLGTWHQLKTEIKSNPDSHYFKKANDEMQRIGIKYRNSKG
jgi:hypothetical protein